MLEGRRATRHPTEFDDIAFDLRRGEILGFYGLVGAGRSEVMQALFGITRPSSAARSTLDGRPIVIRSPADAIAAGIVYVPEERGRQGVVIGMPIFQNVSLPSLAPHLAVAASCGSPRSSRWRASYTERLDLRAAVARARTSARCRAATSRRW